MWKSFSPREQSKRARVMLALKVPPNYREETEATKVGKKHPSSALWKKILQLGQALNETVKRKLLRAHERDWIGGRNSACNYCTLGR